MCIKYLFQHFIKVSSGLQIIIVALYYVYDIKSNISHDQIYQTGIDVQHAEEIDILILPGYLQG